MALSEFEIKRCEHLLNDWLDKRRPALHIRPQLDFGYTLHNQSIELLEIRPMWKRPAEITRRPFARMTFVKTLNRWKLYWMRASGQWYPYEPLTFRRLEDVLDEIQRDPQHCFFG